MSEQHEDHVDEPEVVPVEVSEDHEVVDSDPERESYTAQAEPDESDETVEPDQEEQHQPQDWQEERYERAAADPEYAAQQAIDVDEDDRGPAWDYDEGLAGLARAEALEDDEDADADDSEEV